MGYQALLFCPDQKTARTVTQVLTELDFTVDACTEPFAAVKKLMGQHFDAVVADCDNEQNATLVFKSARSSASNQTSLAVAVVEGQAGVAKAFRMGANLVLTKPINVEQAKGTLRVARGLLRKGEPAKPASSASGVPEKTGDAQGIQPRKSAPATPTPAGDIPRPTSPSASFMSPTASPTARLQSQPPKSTIAFPPSANAGSDDLEDDSIIDVTADNSPHSPISNMLPPATTPTKAFVPPHAEATPAKTSAGTITSPSLPPISSLSQALSVSALGSASAPARARETQESEVAATSTEARRGFVGHAGQNPELSENIFSPPANHVPAPSFTFGGAVTSDESSRGGAKKILFAVAASLIVAGGLYFAWTKFHGKAEAPVETIKPAAPATAAISHAAQPSVVTSPSAPSPAPITRGTPQSKASGKVAPTIADDEESIDSGFSPASENSLKSKSASAAANKIAAATKPAPAVKPLEQPILVRNDGAVAKLTKATKPASDAPAPSMIGIAPADSDGSLPNLMDNAGNTPQPVLQTLNVSQGVSQGLLIKKIQPSYPSNALRMRVEGAVQLQATIGKAGNIVGVKVLSGDPLLARAAAEAVTQWKYKPYLLNGEPVEIQTQVTVNFKLPK